MKEGMVINHYQITIRLRMLALAILSAALIMAVSLVLLQLNVWAKFAASGANGCGNFEDAVDKAEDGDTIAVMIPDRRSEGKTITKNILIHGGWLSIDGCGGQQIYTDTADLDAASFEFQGILSRSILSHDSDSVIKIDPSVMTLTVQNMVFWNNAGTVARGAGISGVISNGAKIRLDNVVISNSVATDAGGGLHLEVRGGSRLVIADSQFFSNEADQTGGGLEIDIYDGSEVIIENTLVASNTANTGHGGGARIRIINSGYVTITNSAFVNNTAGGRGGGLAIESVNQGPAYVRLINTTFANNSASISEDDLYSSGNGLTVDNLSKQLFLPSILSDFPSAAADSARITDISIENNRYIVEFDTLNFEPTLPGQHVHFFFNTVPPQEAGVPGSGPWILYGGPSPFTEYSIIDRPPGAWQMCILVANPDHSVQLNTGNCFDLP
ncbi:MAG: hypothetical protein GWN13_19365 [Phycisphaerae bacterium]|nr:hypothetical protein [Phycisphaerae bacterium]